MFSNKVILTASKNHQFSLLILTLFIDKFVYPVKGEVMGKRGWIEGIKTLFQPASINQSIEKSGATSK